jgi:hypothetical protein
MDLPNRYDSAQGRYDSSFVTVTVTANGSTKSVTDFGEGRPIELWAIQQTLDSVTTSIQWREK